MLCSPPRPSAWPGRSGADSDWGRPSFRPRALPSSSVPLELPRTRQEGRGNVLVRFSSVKRVHRVKESAMISFQPTDDQELMLKAAGQFARTLIRPKLRESEGARAVSAEIRTAGAELGLGLAPFPEALGGAGLGLVTTVLLEEEIASGDAGAAFALAGPGAFGFA